MLQLLPTLGSSSGGWDWEMSPQQMCPPQQCFVLHLWAFSFSWRHLTLPSVMLPAQGPDIFKGILVFLEAVDARAGTAHQHLPDQPVSMIHLLENWERKLSPLFGFFFFFLIAEAVPVLCSPAALGRISFVLFGAVEDVWSIQG